MQKRNRKWAVFISGRGSNLAAILDMRPAVDVAVVVSSSPKAYGLLRARRAGVPILVLPKPIDWRALDRELRARGIDRIFLAGFMRLVPEDFVDLWQGQILNLHPSLLPAYRGLNSIERSHAERAAMGCSVHLVTAELDAGQVLCQRQSLTGAQAEALSLEDAEFRIHLDEQRLVREAIRRWNQ